MCHMYIISMFIIFMEIKLMIVLLCYCVFIVYVT